MLVWSDVLVTAIGLTTMAGLAWLLIRWSDYTATLTTLSEYWSVMYIDDNGVLLATTVRVTAVDPTRRRLTVWCYASDRLRVLKVSKIVRARDVNSGNDIDVSDWLAKAAKTSFTEFRDTSGISTLSNRAMLNQR